MTSNLIAILVGLPISILAISGSIYFLAARCFLYKKKELKHWKEIFDRDETRFAPLIRKYPIWNIGYQLLKFVFILFVIWIVFLLYLLIRGIS